MTDGLDKVIAGIGLIATAFAIEFGLSYAMAGAMINTRSKLHSDMIANAQKEEGNEA